MAIPLLLPLALGGLFGQRLQRGRAETKRGALADALLSGIGTEEQPLSGIFGGGEDLQGLTSSLGGSGLLNDPRFQDQAEQLRFAAELFRTEGGGAIGAGILEQAFGNIQAASQQQRAFGQQEDQQQRAFGQQDFQQDNQFEFQGAQNQLDRDARAEQNDLNREQRQQIADAKASALLLPADPSGAELGPIPSGFERYQHPTLGTVTRALPGTQPYVKAQEEISGYESAIVDIDEVLTGLAETGTEFFGAESGRQAFAYGQILSHVAKLRDLGVLQKSDIEFLQDALTDPSGFSGATTRTSTIIAQFEKAQKFFQAKLANANGKYKLWGLGSGLANTTPEQARELEVQLEQEIAADLLGLSITAEPIPRRRASDQQPGPALLTNRPTAGGRGFVPTPRL